MSSDVLPAAFYRAEAGYLTPPEPDCECDCFVCDDGEHCRNDYCHISDERGDWDEHEWEMNQDAKEAREGL